jgi:hypothetical protein
MKRTNKKAELLRKREVAKNLIAINKTFSDSTKIYAKPQVTKVHVLEPSKKVFMGCWQQNYQLNDGDGC